MSARQLFSQRRNAGLSDITAWGGAGEIIPVLDPRWFIPANTGSHFGLDWVRWYLSDGRTGTKPEPAMMRSIELFRQLQRTMDEDEQIELFQQIIAINHENLWAIGGVGSIPAMYIVKDTFKNVPDVAVACWPLRTPGATAPEIYAIDERKGA